MGWPCAFLTAQLPSAVRIPFHARLVGNTWLTGGLNSKNLCLAAGATLDALKVCEFAGPWASPSAKLKTWVQQRGRKIGRAHV